MTIPRAPLAAHSAPEGVLERTLGGHAASAPEDGMHEPHMAPRQRVFWRQVWVLTLSNLKSRYRKTFAGFVWVLLSPLLMYGVQSLVFSQILKISLPHYGLFLLSGLLPWIFIVQSMDMCTGLFVNHGRLLKSFNVHPLVILFAQVLDNMINFIAAFIMILVPISLFSPLPVTGLATLPISVGLLLLGTFGLAWLLSTVNVFFRDTRFLVSFFLNLAFFITPIFYPVEFVPENLRWIILINPIYPLILPFRTSLYGYDWAQFVEASTISLMVGGTYVLVAFFFWRKKRNELYLYL